MNYAMNWNDAKKEFQKTWTALTPEEIERTRGDKNALSELLQKKCGVPLEESSKKIASVLGEGEKDKPEIAPASPQPEIPDEPNKIFEEQLPPETQLI